MPHRPPDLPTVVLRHDLPDGRFHYDWLLGDPADPTGQGLLLAFRTDRPPSDWPAGRPVDLLALPPHRRRYLQYQGPLGGGRGRVRRIARGRAVFSQWSADHYRLELDWGQGRIPVRLDRLDGPRWQGRILDR